MGRSPDSTATPVVSPWTPTSAGSTMPKRTSLVEAGISPPPALSLKQAVMKIGRQTQSATTPNKRDRRRSGPAARGLFRARKTIGDDWQVVPPLGLMIGRRIALELGARPTDRDSFGL